MSKTTTNKLHKLLYGVRISCRAVGRYLCVIICCARCCEKQMSFSSASVCVSVCLSVFSRRNRNTMLWIWLTP